MGFWNQDGSGLHRAEEIGTLRDLVTNGLIVPDHDDSIALVDEIGSNPLISVHLRRVVVDGAVAEHADVRLVEEVRDAVGLRHRPLRIVRQPPAPFGQGVEKASLQLRTGIGPRTQVGQMRAPVPAAGARTHLAVRQIEQKLPDPSRPPSMRMDG